MESKMDELEPIHITIERSKWLRGEGGNASSLLRAEDGKMCCLGFAALKCGLKPEWIEGKATPGAAVIHHSDDEIDGFKRLFFLDLKEHRAQLGTTISLMSVNDGMVLSEAEREEEITRLGKHVGFIFTFVD